METTAPTSNVLRPVITQAGLASTVGLNGNSVQVNITHISYGTGQYTPTGQETSLRSEQIRVPIAGGTKVSPTAHQVYAAGLRATAGSPWYAYEVGFWAGEVLFAVYAHPSAPVIYISDIVDVVGAYLLGTSALPNDAINIVVDPDAANVYNILANLPLVRYDLQSLTPSEQAQVQKNLGLDQLFATFGDLNLSNNMIRNGGMDIWQERTQYSIPADSAAHVADGFVVHSYSGSSVVSKGDWGTRTPRLVNPDRDSNLPLDILAYLRWQYTPVASAKQFVSLTNGALQNRSFNVKRWAGQRVIVSLWACLESYGGNQNDAWKLDTPAEIKKAVRLGVQQYFGENQITRTIEVFDDSQVIDGRWKQIHAVLDIPMIDATKTIDLNASFSSAYLELSKAFEKGQAFSLVTTAWRVEPCMYPDDYPRDKIKPSPWRATPFVQDLAECRRYYEKSYPVDVPVGSVYADYGNPNARGFGSYIAPNIRFEQPKVRRPSMTFYSAAQGNPGNVNHFGTGPNSANYPVIGVETDAYGVALMMMGGGFNVGVSTTPYNHENGLFEFNWVSDSRI